MQLIGRLFLVGSLIVGLVGCTSMKKHDVTEGDNGKMTVSAKLIDNTKPPTGDNKPPVMSAIDADDLATVKALIDGGIDIEQEWRANGGWMYRPLSYAARTTPVTTSNRIAIVEALLSAGADTNGRSPLVAAQSVEIISRLIAAGSDPDLGCEKCGFYINNVPPLVLRASEGAIEAVRILLDAGADIDGGKDASGTALYSVVRAATFNKSVTEAQAVELIKFLIESGADIEARNRGGDTALYAAFHFSGLSRPGEKEVITEPIRVLMQEGADPVAKDKSGRNPLMIAASNGPARRPPRMAYQVFFSGGGDVALYDYDHSGKTPLFYAVDHYSATTLLNQGAIDTARLFILRGADVNHADNEGLTPLMKATMMACTPPGGLSPRPAPYCAKPTTPCPKRKPYLDMIYALIRDGADKSLRRLDGKTAYDLSHVAGKHCNDIRPILKNN